MITGNDCDEYLILWDLVSGENKRRIKVSGHLRSCSFSPNGNYLAVLKTAQMLGNGKIRNLECLVFDAVNNYTPRHESPTKRDTFDGKKVSLTASKSDIWFVSRSGILFELCYNGKGIDKQYYQMNAAEKQLFFPPTTKSREIVDRSITSQIMPNFKYFRYLSNATDPIPRCLINLHDESHLALSHDSALTLQVDRFSSGNISYDGLYFYQHCQSLRELRVLKRDGKGWIFLNENLYSDVVAFAVVMNGVFIVTAQSIVEIWKIDMSERLMHCQQMASIECCESVSDYLIACVGKTEVSYIDSRDLQIVSTTSVAESQHVLACSSKYDVLVKDNRFQNGECFIMRNNKRMFSVLDANIFQVARFSPNACKLILFDAKFDRGYHCYDISEGPSPAFLKTNGKTPEILCFLDNEYFITFGASKTLCLTGIYSTETLATVFLDQLPTSIFYCRTTQTLIVNYMNNKFQEFRVHFGQKCNHSSLE